MIQRIKRDLLPRFLLFITTVIFLLIVMNLVGIMDKFSKSQLEAYAGENYINNIYYELTFKASADELESSYDKAKEDLSIFFESMKEAKANIFICEIPLQVNNGQKEDFQVYLAFNESVPYPLQSGEYDFDKTGVYIGNANKEFMSETGEVLISRDSLKVLGIMESKSLEQNEEFLVNYNTLSSEGKNAVLEIIMFQKYEMGDVDEPLVICLGSNNCELGEDELLLSKTADKLSTINIEKVTEMEYEDESLSGSLGSIKKVVYIVAFLFCVINVIQVMELYTKRKRKDIAICRAFGKSYFSIYGEMFKEVAVMLLCGGLIAGLLELVVYVWWLGYSLETALLYGLGAIVVLFVMCAIILAVSFMFRLRAGIIDDLNIEY